MNALPSDLPPPGARIVVAMSGGVDSSVVAALLKGRGYDVVGVTLQLYDHGEAVRRKGACCAGQDIHDARRVAERLDIPHYVLDFESRFRAAVMEDFAASYARGETPIPCVQCNRTVKFRDLLGVARDLGASALATGHYVRRQLDDAGRARLFVGADPTRDQSYFMFATTPEQLEFLRFPLGGMGKDETRRLAAEYGLAVADKADSQDICFVPSGRYVDVVERLKPGAAEPGEIVDQSGRVLGRHAGVIHYTVGQRRGLPGGAGEPLFVVRLDPERRQVVVGPRAALLTGRVMLRDVNWLPDGRAPETEIEVEVRVRSSQKPMAARVAPRGAGQADVAFLEPQNGVAPGQACVFYRAGEVLGGGWIQRDRQAVAA